MRLVEVTLACSDPAAAGDFYARTLDLPVTGGAEEVRVGVGSSTLVLRRGPVGPGCHHLALTVPVEAFDGAKRRLADRVPLIRRDGADEFALPAPWRSRSVYVTGPDGLLLELIARQALASPSAHDGPGPVVSISEVGVAVEDVEAAARALRDAWGMPRFDAGGPGFLPVGDDQGLLILVAPRRTWFPTADSVPSEDPLSVVLDPGTAPAGGDPVVLGRCTLRPARR